MREIEREREREREERRGLKLSKPGVQSHHSPQTFRKVLNISEPQFLLEKKNEDLKICFGGIHFGNVMSGYTKMLTGVLCFPDFGALVEARHCQELAR